MNGAELFGGDDRVAVVEAHAAEFFRLGNAQQAKVAGLAEDLVDRKAGLFPFIDVWVDLVFDEVADGAAQFFVFRGENPVLLFSAGSWRSRQLAPEAVGLQRADVGFVADIQQVTEPGAYRAGSIRPSSHRLALP
jgi:hypothetical protein